MDFKIIGSQNFDFLAAASRKVVANFPHWNPRWINLRFTVDVIVLLIPFPGATKSTVVALSAIAGAACGPGAAACGAALAVGANAAWDGADSAIAGENRGIVAAVNNIAEGNANVEQVSWSRSSDPDYT